MLAKPAVILLGKGLAPGGGNRHRLVVVAEIERRRGHRLRRKEGPWLDVGERRKPVFDCRRNRALGSGDRDKVGKARELGVGARSSTGTIAHLVLCDRSCQQLRQLLRQVAERRSQKFVICLPAKAVGQRRPVIAVRKRIFHHGCPSYASHLARNVHS